MLNRDVYACLILFTARSLCAQDDNRSPQFEAASIKLHTPTGAPGTNERSGIEETPGLIKLENLSLRSVIQIAYGVRDYQFDGPEWLSGVRFDIVAKPPADYKHEQLQPLLRNLLADRFKLAVHLTSKQTSGYTLLIVKGGTRLHESAGPRTYFTVRPGLISGTRVSMRELTGALTGRLGYPVVDDTGLAAVYDVTLEWTPDQAPSAPSAGDERKETPEPGPSLFAALRDQLGLRLQTRKVPVDVVIVEHVERLPTDN